MADQSKETSTWTGEHQEAHLTGVPVLAYPDFSWPFELETDASLQGLGVVLL